MFWARIGPSSFFLFFVFASHGPFLSFAVLYNVFAKSLQHVSLSCSSLMSATLHTSAYSETVREFSLRPFLHCLGLDVFWTTVCWRTVLTSPVQEEDGEGGGGFSSSLLLEGWVRSLFCDPTGCPVWRFPPPASQLVHIGFLNMASHGNPSSLQWGLQATFRAFQNQGLFPWTFCRAACSCLLCYTLMHRLKKSLKERYG